MKRTFGRIVVLAFLVAAIVMLVLPQSAVAYPFYTYCNSWSGVHVVGSGFYGVYCGGSGGICAECSTGYNGGYTVCYADNSGSSICIEFQDMSW